MEQVTMRTVLALALFMTLCSSANAAMMHRPKRPQGHSRPRRRVTVTKGYAVPGWTDEETRYWLDNGPSAGCCN
jgi:hypothetical protein